MTGSGRRRFLAPLLLVLGSVLAVLVFGELLLRWSVPHLPLRYHKYLPDEIFVLAQHSKRALLPHDYVALFGDSYAAGAGDWYAAAVGEDRGEGLPYQAAHVIFAATGRDVVSFGASGAGSFDGLVFSPLRLRARLAARGIALEPPRQIVAYFFEGNDLNNNVDLLRRHWPRIGGSVPVTTDLSAMIGFLEDLLEQASPDRPLRLDERPYLARFFAVLYHDLGRLWDDWRERRGRRKKPLPPTPIRLGAAAVELPVPLHGPALDLNEAELRQALLVVHASLALARRIFAPTPIRVVYVPSPLAVYRLAAAQVPVDAYHGPHQVHPAAAVDRRSDRICITVAAAAAALGVDFLDTRPLLRAVARERLLHGPNDWKHFNRAGYETLGRAIAAALGAGPGSGRCAARPRPENERSPG